MQNYEFRWKYCLVFFNTTKLQIVTSSYNLKLFCMICWSCKLLHWLWMWQKLLPRNFSTSLMNQILGARTFCQFDISATWHFVKMTFCQHDRHSVNMTIGEIDIFSTWHCVRMTFCQHDFLSIWYFCQHDILLTWHCVKMTFCQHDILSIWHFVKMTFCQNDISSLCHFVKMAFCQHDILSKWHLCQIDILLKWHFINWQLFSKGKK